MVFQPVEKILRRKPRTGDILLFVFEEDGKSLSGHLRVRATGRADFAGRRGLTRDEGMPQSPRRRRLVCSILCC